MRFKVNAKLINNFGNVESAPMSLLDIPTDDFRRLAAQVTDLAAEYLASMDSRPIFPHTTGEQTVGLFQATIPEEGQGAKVFTGLWDIVDHGRAQNGRFFGYVLGSGEPVGAIADLLASVLNQNVTAWRSAPAAVTLERTVVSWLAEAIGCAGFQGSLTGGGSLANLMGLAMAREAKAPANERGLPGRQCVVYASDEVHMSIPKSVALLGMGWENLRLIPTGRDFRMVPAALERAIQDDKAAARTPISVVASAGTVNTGAIDPLPEIAAIVRRHNLWLHIDGAYGALAAIAAPAKFAGLESADSISLDPHKWLFQSLDCGCLLYRDASAAQRAFSHAGDYAKSLSTDPIEGFAFFEESIELSRRFRALRLWLSLRYHGMRAFREAIRRNMDLASRLGAAIASHPEFELLAPIELSAVCFRHNPQKSANNEDLNHHNAALLKQLIKRGRVYLSNATVHGKFALRACIVNHRTTEADVDSVITEVLSAAEGIQPDKTQP
ncbi:MAG TPA: pyridoxal-dependent decarboxylase [Terriglobales bacterium]|nr:pyridoxal-dependent decarboxylase [Terriglobales bacterium]